MDYLIPTAMGIPEIEIRHLETPSDVLGNYRGVGEGGMIGAPAAITNAIEDALFRPPRPDHRAAPPGKGSGCLSPQPA
jgi:CO/xanthine dehydrogenase Mo-binding subunit